MGGRIGTFGSSPGRKRRHPDRSSPRATRVPDYSPHLFPRSFRLPVLMYHDIGEPAARYRIPLWQLEQQLDWLWTNGYVTISLEQAYEALLNDAPLPSGLM